MRKSVLACIRGMSQHAVFKSLSQSESKLHRMTKILWRPRAVILSDSKVDEVQNDSLKVIDIKFLILTTERNWCRQWCNLLFNVIQYKFVKQYFDYQNNNIQQLPYCNRFKNNFFANIFVPRCIPTRKKAIMSLVHWLSLYFFFVFVVSNGHSTAWYFIQKILSK